MYNLTPQEWQCHPFCAVPCFDHSLAGAEKLRTSTWKVLNSLDAKPGGHLGEKYWKCIHKHSSLFVCPMISFPSQIWRKTLSNTWLLTLRHGEWLFCNRIRAVKWFILHWSPSRLIEHAVKLCRWARRWNPALICCQGGRCFILLVCSLAFLTDVKQKQKKLNCCAFSPLFSKVVLQLISPVILWSVRRGMHLLTSLITVLYTFFLNLLYSASCNFQLGWFS